MTRKHDPKTLSSFVDYSFVEAVRRRKAITHLMLNDPLFKAIAYRMATSQPEESIWVAVECAAILADKIKNTAPQMNVSEQEKREGYPLPRDDEERRQRAMDRAMVLMTTRIEGSR